MTLTPSPTQPGLWTNPDWTPGTPGTFALLIGVSRYDHLDGGTGPLTANNYGLGQLAVSAWTAYALFEWLRTTYQFGPAPLAQCWLLLAPTEAEKTKIGEAITASGGPDVLTHNQLATFTNQEEAVLLWNQAMSNQPKTAAESSRAVFFFSGHGLEIHTREQILLPADYLRLPQSHNRALNIRKLSDAMTRLAVCDQFFFVDACRNTHPDLASLNIEGSGIITIASGEAINSACNSAILYATATGMPAHQYSSPNDGYSLFGQSLLDGLRSQQGFVPECIPAPCSVQLAPLQRFIGQRYNQLLTAAGWSTRQFIKLGSEPLDLFSVITQVPPPIAPAPMLPSVKELERVNFTKRLDVSLTSNNAASGPRYRIDRSFDVADQGAVLEGLSDQPKSDTDLHGVLGRESATAFWGNAKLYSFRVKDWLPTTSLALIKVDRTTHSTGYQLTCRLMLPPGPYWLELTDGLTTYGIPLPPTVTENACYRLDFNITADRHMSDLQANLAHESEGRLARVADLWDKYQTVDVSSAADMVDMGFLHGALQSKMSSPFAALIGAMVLLQARRYDLANGDWLKNLATWFPELPDGLLLRNQWLMQTNASDRSTELITNLLALQTQGMPFTGEAFSLALLQLDRLLESTMPQPDQQLALERLREHYRKALRYFQTGGLLAVFAGKPGSFTPASLGYA